MYLFQKKNVLFILIILTCGHGTTKPNLAAALLAHPSQIATMSVGIEREAMEITWTTPEETSRFCRASILNQVSLVDISYILLGVPKLSKIMICL